MIKIIFAILLLCWPTLSSAEPWDTTDKVLAATSTTVLVIDWGQTRYIAKHPDLFMETNKILGSHPAVSKVDGYFVTAILGSLLIADNVSSMNRKFFLGTLTIVELRATHKNKQIGVKIAF